MDSVLSADINDGIDLEIVVVDNNSTDATAEVVRNYADSTDITIRYIIEQKQGLSYARNRGIREAEGNVLAFIDDDVIVAKDWINSIFSTFQDSAVSCAGGRIYPVWLESRPKWLNQEFHKYLSLLDLGNERIRMDKPGIWGANLIFRASLFETYGMFDTALGRTAGKLYGEEEVVVVKRLIDNGAGVYYVPEIVVHHCIGPARMKKSYYRKWYFDTGELAGIQLGHYPHRNLNGVPYYVLKDFFFALGRFIAGIIRQPENIFLSELSLLGKAGFINGRCMFQKSLKVHTSAGRPEYNKMTPALPQSKDKVLIVSPAIPRPDMNSGDMRLSSLIDILAQKYSITFISVEYKPGDDRYISRLEGSGVTVYSKQFSLLNMLKNEQFKIAIMEFYFTAEFYLNRIRILQPECRVIVDSVDVHYLRLKQKYDLTKDEADLAIYEETKEKEINVYRKADAVITVTTDDAAALIKESSDIRCEVVPNIHEISLTDASPEKNTLIFVGGFSHDPNIDAVLYFCREILPLIRKNKPDVHVMIVGSNPPDEIVRLGSDSVTVTGYVPTTTTYLHRSCVSVAPLRYGAGMKGKIGEAMAHGVPVVTTPVGAQGMGLTDRKNVMISDSPQHFAAAVVELLNDRSLYDSIRNDAVRIIDDNYTTPQVAKSMIDVIEKVCNSQVKRMSLVGKALFLKDYVMDHVKSRFNSTGVEYGVTPNRTARLSISGVSNDAR